jgi:hypothetical protein
MATATKHDWYVDGDLIGEAPRTEIVRQLAELWHSRSDVDSMLTVSFSQEVHDRYGFRRSRVLMGFVKRILRSVKYDGAYVIVVHDNRGTSYFHVHMLLTDGGKGTFEKVKRAFFPYGDVNHVGNGPIRGLGAFIYCANRAVEAEGCNRFDDADRYDFRPISHEVPKRRFRPRGRRHSRRNDPTAQLA